MKDIHDGLQGLLEKYGIDGSARLKRETLKLSAGNAEIPLLPWRHERRLMELRNLAIGGTLDGISAIRALRMERKGADLRRLLYRELDLCQWIAGSAAESVFAVRHSDKAIHVIVTLETKVVCTIEVSATLPDDAQAIDKHEIISRKGTACDRVVDTQVPQHSVYLFSQQQRSAAYLDVDFELYDYDHEEVALIRQAFDVMRNPDLAAELSQGDIRARKLLAAVEQSVETKNHLATGGFA